MNTHRFWLAPTTRIIRHFLVFMSVVALLIVSGDAKATGDFFARASMASLTSADCNDTNCLYLPVVQSPNPCLVGQVLSDPANDVSPAYIDVTSMTSSFSGTSLTATLNLRDVPTTLIFNRVGVNQNFLEYGWSIHVDVDNNLATGYPNYPYTGTEIMMGADHFVSQPNSPVSLPIQNGVQANTWIYDSAVGGWRFGTWVTLTVNPTSNTMRMTGTIPGLNVNSRLLFETNDYNPGGSRLRDLSSCSETSTGSQQGMESQAHFGLKLSPDGLLERMVEPPQ